MARRNEVDKLIEDLQAERAKIDELLERLQASRKATASAKRTRKPKQLPGSEDFTK